MSNVETKALSTPRPRLESLDAFRGFTILGMIFVIAVAAGGYQREAKSLPQTMSWFGSLPISTWFHADVGYALWKEQKTAEWTEALVADATFAPELAEQPEQGTEAVKAEVAARIAAAPESNLKDIGVTFTDLIAPWFVFIVGAVIPIGRVRPGAEWWRHVFFRTFMLILAGILYISLVIKQVTWWWGVLQAIGIAYLCAALLTRAAPGWRWPIVLAVGGVNLVMTELFPWWTTAWESVAAPFGTLSNPNGNWFKPWIVHCQPWLSVSYGVMAMIGVLVGEALATRDPKQILRRSLLVGGVFTLLGYGIHKIGFITSNFSLCMNKPDVTTSYAFFTAGVGALTFLAFYWVIDVIGIRGWAKPLNVFGVNPLLAYFMQIIMRRVFESLGVVDYFQRVSTGTNATVNNWAIWFGTAEEPSQRVLDFFAKGGFMGVLWGLIWTLCLWLIIVWCNRRNWIWRF